MAHPNEALTKGFYAFFDTSEKAITVVVYIYICYYIKRVYKCGIFVVGMVKLATRNGAFLFLLDVTWLSVCNQTPKYTVRQIE